MILTEDKMCCLYNRRFYIYIYIYIFELFKNKFTQQQLLTIDEVIL